MHRGRGLIHLPAGGNIAEATFSGSEGLVLLVYARIVDASGRTVATLGMDGPNLVATFPGSFPDVISDALSGRTAGDICSVFSADPRGDGVKVRSASNVFDGPCLRTIFADSLVPLLPTVKGGERWRPRKAVSIVGSRFGRGTPSLVTATHARTLRPEGNFVTAPRCRGCRDSLMRLSASHRQHVSLQMATHVRSPPSAKGANN